MSDIYTTDYVRSLPPPLKSDPEMVALAEVIAEEMRITAAEIKNTIIYARIDELPEPILDMLAYDLRVDWYDYTYPIDAKRKTIRDSIRVHRQIGTKYAVETALNDVFPGTRIEEWFEYGGPPFTFRVTIDATMQSVTAEKQKKVLDRVRFYKNLRSHLTSVKFEIERNIEVNIGAYCSTGTKVEIWPYRFEFEIERNIEVNIGAYYSAGIRSEIWPEGSFK